MCTQRLTLVSRWDWANAIAGMNPYQANYRLSDTHIIKTNLQDLKRNLNKWQVKGGGLNIQFSWKEGNLNWHRSHSYIPLSSSVLMGGVGHNIDRCTSFATQCKQTYETKLRKFLHSNFPCMIQLLLEINKERQINHMWNTRIQNKPVISRFFIVTHLYRTCYVHRAWHF